MKIFRAAASALAMMSLMTTAYAKPPICPTVAALSQFEFLTAKEHGDKRWEVFMPPHRFDTDNDWRFALGTIIADSAEEAIQKGNGVIKHLFFFKTTEPQGKDCIYFDFKDSIYAAALST